MEPTTEGRAAEPADLRQRFIVGAFVAGALKG
jgi:hypothetical protein